MTKDSTIGARFRRKVRLYCALNETTETEVLSKSGISRGVYNNGCASKKGPRVKDIANVAKSLSVSILDLLRDEEGLITETAEDSGPSFKRNVLALLDKDGRSVDWLADQVGVKPHRLREVLDAQNPGVRLIREIAGVLKATMDELLEEVP